MNPEVYKIFSRVKFEVTKATEKTLWGRRPTTKKIKRRLSYEVSFWYDGKRATKWFHSAKRMRKYVNAIHESTMMDIPEVIIEKTWCYRNHHPRHKWWYISTKPNQFICYERY
jgi:hypothetical protein